MNYNKSIVKDGCIKIEQDADSTQWDIVKNLYFEMDIACRKFWAKRNMPYPSGSWHEAKKRRLDREEKNAKNA